MSLYLEATESEKEIIQNNWSIAEEVHSRKEYRNEQVNTKVEIKGCGETQMKQSVQGTSHSTSWTIKTENEAVNTD